MTTPAPLDLPLKLGSRGDTVKRWQRFLNFQRKTGLAKVALQVLAEDGVFGAASQTASAAWKRAHYPVGPLELVGTATWQMAAKSPCPSRSTLPGRSLCAGSPLRRLA